MPMTVIVTNNAPERVRGFLSSVACEIAPGVYTSPRMTVAVRDRIWAVLSDWFPLLAPHSIVMTWPASDQPGGQSIRTLGLPRTEVLDYHGIFLTWHERSPSNHRTLTEESNNAQATGSTTDVDLAPDEFMSQDQVTLDSDIPSA